MKKKRFYNNKKRGKKWTEQEKGRKISFADKYADPDLGTNKFDNTKPTQKEKFFSPNNARKILKTAIVVVCSFAIISVGYTIMDVHLERNAMPISQAEDDSGNGIGSVELKIKAEYIEPLTLDGGVMLTSIIDEALSNGKSSVAFDLKRNDGTVGYVSQLATVNAYGAISSASQDFAGSTSTLVENDIMPVGIVSCYRDNIAPREDSEAALMVGGRLYEDESGCTYLNPKSPAAYNYIKSIIEEARSQGVTVFVLTDFTLPSEVGDNKGDGFDILSRKLTADFGDGIKLIRGERITLNEKGVRSSEKEYQEKTEGLDKNTVLIVTAKNSERAQKTLDSHELGYIM